jgi:hypothetical protein
MKTETEDNRSERQAELQLESIREMVNRLRHARECDGEECEATDEEILTGLNYHYSGQRPTDEQREEYNDEDKAREAIEQDPLSVEIRSGWYTPGSETDKEPSEYRILLAWGGPACQIRGELDEYRQPETARIEHQDWGTPWTKYRISSEDEEILLEYARCFYFGD